ncbi:MAG: PIN domain-containing protein [Deltaproteobacteria bacterium]|nr:PIN domain-containing protein [Deltaproteobacteria bacterium]
MRRPTPYFIDTSAWLALAIVGDPYHDRACAAWQTLVTEGSKAFTSVPVIIETFTFLDRNTTRQTALQWQAALGHVRRLRILECSLANMDRAWSWFLRKELHKLSAVDATSFTLMQQQRIARAFAFDVHFAMGGFTLVEA